jgi:UDP-N-acetylglucosamine 2-epimerase (non-hydrolysing)
MRVVCVAAARPNFMKVKPVLDALEAAGAQVLLVHTGQHYDRGMSDVFFDELSLRPPDHHLGVGAGSHAEQTGRIMTEFEPLLDKLQPDVVVVVGDVNSTVACALVAAKAGVRVAHVEAGLRSRDWSMPEEVNRVVTDRLSDYLFAPSPDAAANLSGEGYRADQIHLVGNVMVDTLLANVDRARAGDVHRRLGLPRGGYGLVTLHRPANVDAPERLRELLAALALIAEDCPLVFPVHPRTRRMLAGAELGPGLTLLPPLGYLDFIALQADARIVLTDSGGVQEETTVLGVPCLTLRENTERPITITEGTNTLAGIEPAGIVAAARRALAHPPAPRRPELWDGHAGDRIADVLVAGHGRPRPGPTARPDAARPARRRLFGIGVDPLTIEQTVASCLAATGSARQIEIGVVNAAKIVKMRRDTGLRAAVAGCDLIVADGQAVVWASRLLGAPLPERVAGIDLFLRLLAEAEQRGLSVYFLGARPEVLSRTLAEVRRLFPALIVAGSRDGYYPDADAPAVADAVADSRADLLFLGMTSPRKERFVADYGRRTRASVVHGVGGSFDVLAGTVRRAPVAWQRAGLEWLFRAVQEPRRLGGRYLRTNVAFIALVLHDLVRRPRPAGTGAE